MDLDRCGVPPKEVVFPKLSSCAHEITDRSFCSVQVEKTTLAPPAGANASRTGIFMDWFA